MKFSHFAITDGGVFRDAITAERVAVRHISRAICIAIAFLLILTAGHAHLSAGIPVREGDSVWEVSSRHLSGSCQAGMPLKISKVVGCSFQPSSLDDFLADPVVLNDHQTVVYVHGNWMEWKVARERGLYVYQLLSAQSEKPIRLILFSWPSERDGRIAPDVREKASLAHVESYYLADFLKHVPTDRSIGMMGYSFGGAVICGTLHMLGGGTLDGRALPQPIAAHQNVKVSLVAPAFDRDQLGPRGKYSQALGQVERLVNLYNSVDPVLKRFRFIDRGSHEAAGLLGINSRSGMRLLTAPNVEQYDCSRAAGRTHSEVEYYRNCPAFKTALQNALRQNALRQNGLTSANSKVLISADQSALPVLSAEE